MRLMDTTLSSDADGFMTVDFLAEGGEQISVRMAGATDISPEAAVTRAKQMMVQLTAFEFADGNDSGDSSTSHSPQAPSGF